MTRNTVADRIRAKLTAGFHPVRLAVHDDSAQHSGHAGAQPGGETHFRVEIVSSNFNGQSRIQRQRMVYSALAEEMHTGVHALQLTTLTPEEDKKL